MMITMIVLTVLLLVKSEQILQPDHGHDGCCPSQLEYFGEMAVAGKYEYDCSVSGNFPTPDVIPTCVCSGSPESDAIRDRFSRQGLNWWPDYKACAAVKCETDSAAFRPIYVVPLDGVANAVLDLNLRLDGANTCEHTIYANFGVVGPIGPDDMIMPLTHLILTITSNPDAPDDAPEICTWGKEGVCSVGGSRCAKGDTCAGVCVFSDDSVLTQTFTFSNVKSVLPPLDTPEGIARNLAIEAFVRQVLPQTQRTTFLQIHASPEAFSVTNRGPLVSLCEATRIDFTHKQDKCGDYVPV